MVAHRLPADDQSLAADGHAEVYETHGIDRRATWALLLYGLVAFGLLVFWYGRNDWFSGGDWNLLAGPATDEVFLPIEQHWTTVPVLLYQGYLRVFGLDYLPFLITVVTLHLMIVAELWLVMRRAHVRPLIAALTSALLVLFGPGWLSLVMPIQITQNLTLVLGLGQLLLSDHRGRLNWRDGAGLGAGAVSLMCSGVAPALIAATAMSTLLRRGWKVALFHTAPLAIMFLAWYQHYELGARNPLYQGGAYDVGNHLRFVWSGATAAFGALGAFAPVGFVFAALLVVGMVLRLSRGPVLAGIRELALPLSLLLASVLYLAVVGYQRASIDGYADFSHHLYTVVALCLPALACAADEVAARWRPALPAIALLFVAAMIPNAQFGNADRPEALRSDFLQARKEVLYETIETAGLSEEDPVDPDAVVYPPFPNYTATATLGWLDDQLDAGRIPAR